MADPDDEIPDGYIGINQLPNMRHPSCSCPESDEDISIETHAMIVPLADSDPLLRSITGGCWRQLAVAHMVDACLILRAHHPMADRDIEEAFEVAKRAALEFAVASEQQTARHATKQ